MRARLASTLLLAALGACPVPAHADAPLVSETADVIDTGKCQLELAAAHARTPGLPSAHGADVLGSCGVLGNSQAALGYTHTREDGASAREMRAFVKTTLVAPQTGHTGYGLRYGVRAQRQPDGGWRTGGFELLGMATREIAPGLLLHLNLGHVHDQPTRLRTTTWSLGIETAADTTVAADLFGDDRGRPAVSAGIGTHLGKAFSVNTSVAVRLENPRVRIWTLGAKIEF